jgi:hypothetical protein
MGEQKTMIYRKDEKSRKNCRLTILGNGMKRKNCGMENIYLTTRIEGKNS